MVVWYLAFLITFNSGTHYATKFSVPSHDVCAKKGEDLSKKIKEDVKGVSQVAWVCMSKVEPGV